MGRRLSLNKHRQVKIKPAFAKLKSAISASIFR